MNKQLKKNLMLVVMTILLLAACAPVPETSTVSTPMGAPSVSVKGLAPEKFSQYVGMNYPPLPAGLTETMGMLIQDANEHSFSLITDGETKMLWFSQLTHHDANGNAFWQVGDILDLSKMEEGVYLLPDGCSLNGVPDNGIITVGKDGVILQAWRANTTLNVFEVIPVNGIECHSDKAMEL